MRPDTAAAFDRLAAAARKDGILLSITSAFRSDAEQAKLFAAHPDPKWVAPPGQSLHRNGTELDLGPPAAYGWLDRNAPRFGFVRRYQWEPWHFGFGPAPGSAAASAARAGSAAGSASARSDGASARSDGASRGSDDPSATSADGAETAEPPAFVPDRWRDALVRASAKWNVPVELLAAQLYDESNFNPFAVSGAGARGLAQFTPGTALAYGLADPFDGAASIEAQAHLMHDLLAKFKTAALALAAYNAGPGAVDRYGGIPPFAETQGYVAKVLGLMSGAGAIAGGFLGIRLVA
jgi:soluble lytic murein transglycosylase-like protein